MGEEVGYDRSMVQDRDAQDQAASKAQEMVREIRSAISKQGGFTGDNVRRLVASWTELGMFAKGNGYWNATRLVWNLSHDNGNFARKTSEELLKRLVRLEKALSSHADIKERFYAFRDAQEAMLVFVYEYRSKLRQRSRSELQQFDGQLAAWVGSLDPNRWRKLGD